MSAPIPRPPGLWRALARENALNPEEAAVLAAVRAAHHQDTEPEPAGKTPRQKLCEYEPLLHRMGWRVCFTATEERARIEAFHPEGPAVMLTAVRGRDGINPYVLPTTAKPHWLKVNITVLQHFVVHRELPPDAAHRRPGTKCRCGKGKYPTEAIAKATLTEITLKRVIKRRGCQQERRAYRCDHDDRVWHLTKIAHWHGQPQPTP